MSVDADPDPGHTFAPFAVAGVGASAGGITALQALFAAIPATKHVAFVVVQHRLPNNESALASVFSRWTPMPVCEATDGVRVEPGCVYLAPPTQLLTVEGGVFVTRSLDKDGARPGNSTIDTFLESLASDFGPRGIAVILTGTAWDGAAGAVRVKQAGGTVLVQDPLTAAHDGMPTAAIATGAADHVMPLGPLARQLVALATPGTARQAPRHGWQETGPALDAISDVLRERTGLELGAYKTAPLLWRIQRRMEQRRVPSFRDYAMLLRDDPVEVEALSRLVPIHVTGFFRDAAVWELLEREVVPHVLDEGRGAVRVWTPACATGEEAYSLAMLLAEHAAQRDPPSDFQVFASDVSSEIVARASRGSFPPAAMKGVSPARQEQFFYAADGGFRVKRELREKMVFAPQDLLADPPFTDIDIVTCRNLLIYLDAGAKNRVLQLLHTALRMGGYLVLGQSEELPVALARGFRSVSLQNRVYKKTGALDVSDVDYPRWPVRLPRASSANNLVEAVTHEAAVEESGLPSLLLDERLNILRIYGDPAPFLRFRPGEPTLNATRVVHEATHLEHAAKQALADAATVHVDGLRDPTTGEPTMALRVTPIPAVDGAPRLMVSFVRAASALAREVVPGGEPDWTEALRASHEELDASREELQALNEELRSANDQLNASNERLNQANEQLRATIAELQTQSDVLSSGVVMALFLDEDLRVRWFTPGVTQLFPLRASDAGRALTDLSPHFTALGFDDDIAAVVRTGEKREAEVRAADGRRYLYRIRPFRTEETRDAGGRGAGVAITFEDITTSKLLEERQAFLLRFSDALRAEPDEDAIANRALRMLLEQMQVDRCYVGVYRLAEDRGDFTHQVGNERVPRLPDAVRLSDFPDALRVAFDTTLVIDDVTTSDGLGDTDRRNLQQLNLRAIVAASLRTGPRDPLWSIVAVSASPRRWTPAEVALIEEATERAWSAIERASGDAALRQSRERSRTLIETMAQGYCEFEMVRDAQGRAVDQLYMDFNPAFERIFGIPVAQARGKRATEVFPGLEAFWIEASDRVARSGSAERIEHEVATLGRWFEVQLYPRGRGDRLSALYQDITDRKRAEALLAERVARQSFLLALSDSLGALRDPDEILATFTEQVGRHFHVRRCGYGELSPQDDRLVVAAEWAHGDVTSARGTWPLASIGETLLAQYRAGHTVVIDDAAPRAPGASDMHPDADAPFGEQARASVAVPLVKGGRWVATFYVEDDKPRHWSEGAVALMQELAERVWTIVGRARTATLGGRDGAGVPKAPMTAPR